MKTILSIILIFFLAGNAFADRETIRIGTTPNYPPLIYKKGGKYMGIEAELASLLSRELGAEIVYVELPMDSIISALQEGQVDMIMSGLSVTNERQSQVQFLFPFMTISQMALVSRETEQDFESADNIYETAMKVGFEKGTTGELLVSENMPKAEKVSFNSPEEGIKALRQKKIGMFIYDSPFVWNIINEDENEDLAGLFWPLTEEDIAWAVEKNNTELGNRINTALLNWKRNGTLTKILNRWIQVKRTFIAWQELEE